MKCRDVVRYLINNPCPGCVPHLCSAVSLQASQGSQVQAVLIRTALLQGLHLDGLQSQW